MKDTATHPEQPVCIEEIVKDSLNTIRHGILNRYQDCENHVRKSPTASVLGAVAFGYLLHRLPLRAILVTKVRVLSALAPPALFLFGAAKLIGFLQRQHLNKETTTNKK
jgi:hypothetical protein